jgi:hypothetical protein
MPEMHAVEDADGQIQRAVNAVKIGDRTKEVHEMKMEPFVNSAVPAPVPGG